jgi:hypothetical protein
MFKNRRSLRPAVKLDLVGLGRGLVERCEESLFLEARDFACKCRQVGRANEISYLRER